MNWTNYTSICQINSTRGARDWKTRTRTLIEQFNLFFVIPRRQTQACGLYICLPEILLYKSSFMKRLAQFFNQVN